MNTLITNFMFNNIGTACLSMAMVISVEASGESISVDVSVCMSRFTYVIRVENVSDEDVRIYDPFKQIGDGHNAPSSAYIRVFEAERCERIFWFEPDGSRFNNVMFRSSLDEAPRQILTLDQGEMVKKEFDIYDLLKGMVVVDKEELLGSDIQFLFCVGVSVASPLFQDRIEAESQTIQFPPADDGTNAQCGAR